MQKTLAIFLFSILLFVGGINAQDTTTTTITFDEQTISTASQGVTVRANTAIIQSAGVYTLTGTSTDAQVIVNTSGSVTLILDNLDLTSATTAPIFIERASSATIELETDSINSLTDAPNRRDDDRNDDDADATIYSEVDLTFMGEGMLNINGRYEDGIHTERNLTFIGGEYLIVAREDGIVGEYSVTLMDTLITIEAGETGIKTDEDDNQRGFIQINDSTINIDAGDDGINAEGEIVVNDSTLTIISAEDGISADDDDFILNGGQLVIYARDQAFDVNQYFINDGVVVISDQSRSSGRNRNMFANPALSIRFDGRLDRDTAIHIQSDNRDHGLTFIPVQGFNNVIVSSPDFVAGEPYTISYGGTVTGEPVNGLLGVEDGDAYTGGQASETVTLESFGITSLTINTGSRR